MLEQEVIEGYVIDKHNNNKLKKFCIRTFKKTESDKEANRATVMLSGITDTNTAWKHVGDFSEPYGHKYLPIHKYNKPYVHADLFNIPDKVKLLEVVSHKSANLDYLPTDTVKLQDAEKVIQDLRNKNSALEKLVKSLNDESSKLKNASIIKSLDSKEIDNGKQISTNKESK